MLLNIVSEADPGRKTSPARTEAVRNHLEQVLQSSVFAGSRRSQDMLRYVVEQASHGNADLLKERLIGIAVFRRATDYDTASDSTVRVAANEVRKRLAQYYMSEGRNAELRIELPSRGYMPRFEFRGSFREVVVEDLAAKPSVGAPSRRRVSITTLVLAAIAVAALSLSLNLWTKNRDLARTAG
jgi:hypothetical protein